MACLRSWPDGLARIHHFRYTYAFWVNSGYTAHVPRKTAFWRRVMFGPALHGTCEWQFIHLRDSSTIIYFVLLFLWYYTTSVTPLALIITTNRAHYEHETSWAYRINPRTFRYVGWYEVLKNGWPVLLSPASLAFVLFPLSSRALCWQARSSWCGRLSVLQ